LGLLATPFSSTVRAEESRLREHVKFGLEIDSSSSLGYSVDVPGRVVPRYPDEVYREHKCVGSGSIMSFGPRLQLTSLLSGSVRLNLSSIGREGSSHVTYWGGYGIGEYACIGAVETRKEPFSYDLTFQTPQLIFFESQGYGLKAFVSYVRCDFDMFYKSGYHMYGEPFYKIEERFKIGDFRSDGFRTGIACLFEDEGIEGLLKLFYQQNYIEGRPTEQGKDFRWQNKDDLAGFGIEILF